MNIEIQDHNFKKISPIKGPEPVWPRVGISNTIYQSPGFVTVFTEYFWSSECFTTCWRLDQLCENTAVWEGGGRRQSGGGASDTAVESRQCPVKGWCT